MKRLTLIRHAKSSWKDQDLDDFDRPLNKRGKRDAPMMGERLTQRDVLPDIIISSPAKRAIKTAKIIAAKIGYSEKKIVQVEEIYEAHFTKILAVIQKLDDKYEHAMIFGHNPGFTHLSNYLADRQVDNIPTCGVYCMEFEVASWKQMAQGAGTCLFFDYPKK